MFTQLTVSLFKKDTFSVVSKKYLHYLQLLDFPEESSIKMGQLQRKALSPVVLADLIAGRANKLLKNLILNYN